MTGFAASLLRAIRVKASPEPSVQDKQGLRLLWSPAYAAGSLWDRQEIFEALEILRLYIF